MDNKIIKKITIEIAGQELKLTPEQAKELHQALSDLMGRPTITVTPTWVWPYYTPTYPNYSYPNGSLGTFTSGPITCSYNAQSEEAHLQIQ